MPKLSVRIHRGKVEHHAEGFQGQDCQQVGEAYLNRFGLDLSDTREEPTETTESTEVQGGGN